MRRKIQWIALGVIIVLMILHLLKITGILGPLPPLIALAGLNPYGGNSLTFAIVVVTILGGRFFCKFFCPVGTLQDLCSELAEGGNLPQMHLDGKWEKVILIKYGVLLCVIALVIMGKGPWIGSFSPWRAFLSIPLMSAAWKILWPGFVALAGLLLVGLFIPRIFCRVLCPLGAFLGLLSAFSSYREEPQLKCGIIECVGCTECKEAKTKKIWFGKERREGKYVVGMLLLFLILWIAIPSFQTQETKIFVPAQELAQLEDGKYEGSGSGYNGEILVAIAVKNNRLIQVEVKSHKESPGWYEEVFLSLPQEMVETQTYHVDSITGATRTSEGLKEAVKDAMGKGAY